MAKMRLTVSSREEEGAYVSRCRELELASCGDTLQEALDTIREGTRALDMLQDLEPVLTSPHTFTSVIEVEG